MLLNSMKKEILPSSTAEATEKNETFFFAWQSYVRIKFHLE